MKSLKRAAQLAALFVLSTGADAQHFSYSGHPGGGHGRSRFTVSLGFGGHHAKPRFSAYGHHGGHHRVWVPGHYVNQQSKVWVAGSSHQVWVPALFETRFQACGTPFQFQVRAGYFRTVIGHGHYEYRPRQVWVSGGWSR